MRYLPSLLFLCFMVCCNEPIDLPSGEYREITDMLSPDEFEEIKSFILDKGDRETYCNMLNNTPHFSFGDFETYLHPDIGQANINCDPALSNFNILVIRDQEAEQIYFHLLLVRKGDLSNELIHGPLEGMREKRVYLLNYDGYDMDVMEEQVSDYVESILGSI